MNEEIYKDQAPINNSVGERTFSSAHTRWGIKGIESAFAQRIRNARNFDELDTIQIEVKADIHLHQMIKNNLLINIDRQREDL